MLLESNLDQNQSPFSYRHVNLKLFLKEIVLCKSKLKIHETVEVFEIYNLKELSHFFSFFIFVIF